MRVLVLEAYYGGSHRRFIEDLRRWLPFEFAVLTLPARKWKWRIRTSAMHFARALANGEPNSADFDLILTTPFMDVAAFRSLAPSPIARLPVLLYWHENQFGYPSFTNDERDFAYLFSNVLSACSADANVFNSCHNRDDFLRGASDLLAKAPDVDLGGVVDRLRSSSFIMPVPLDLGVEAPCIDPRPPGPPIILWNHRWDYDKHPEAFHRAIVRLDELGRSFRLAVVGETFREKPAVFADIERRFDDRLVAFGFQPTRDEYLAVLRSSSIVVSTTRQEYQGLSIIEAALQGATPVAPAGLAYSEFLPKERLYRDEDDLVAKLDGLVCEPPPPAAELIEALSRFSWTSSKAAFEELFRRVGTHCPRR